MATNPMPAEPLLQAAMERLESGSTDVLLDLSDVRRLDPAALQSFQQLAAKAQEKSARVLVRGVDVHVYKVLKLVRLADQFSFLN